jgi:hypothetical protein
MDFLGDIGGIVEIIFFFNHFLLASLPGQVALLTIMNRLFVVKTSVNDMFNESEEKEKNGDPMKTKVKNQYDIDFSKKQMTHFKL